MCAINGGATQQNTRRPIEPHFKEETPMSTQLGTLAELPTDYVEELAAMSVTPLWPSLRAVLPYGKPSRNTTPFAWR